MEISGNTGIRITPSRDEFLRLAAGPAHPPVIPVSVTVPGVSLSPTELFRSMKGYPGNDDIPATGDTPGYLLEYMDGEEKAPASSYIGVSPLLRISLGDTPGITGVPGLISLIPPLKGRDPVGIMRDITAVFHAPPGSDPGKCSKLVGYFSYDTIRSFLPLHVSLRHHPAEGSPVAEFMLCAHCASVDHALHTLTLAENMVVAGAPDLHALYDVHCRALLARYALLKEEISRASIRRADVPPGPGTLPAEAGECTAQMHIPCSDNEVAGTKNEFIRDVAAVKEYIRAGEIIQAVISRKDKYPFAGDPLLLYRALMEINPSPYMYYLEFPNHTVVGASPEMLVRVRHNTVTTVPIAGTRRRGRGNEEDLVLARELLQDEKERAEHVMLVDLARNDIGSVSDFGTVEVSGFMRIGRYSHVQHIVSTVSGKISCPCDMFDALKACFPAGTVSGAPKIRAIQIIDAIEPGPRGIYAGAVGYIGLDDTLEFAIAIRTMDVRDGLASVQVGAGIVADSSPPDEWAETCHKAAALRAAITRAGGRA